LSFLVEDTPFSRFIFLRRLTAWRWNTFFPFLTTIYFCSFLLIFTNLLFLLPQFVRRRLPPTIFFITTDVSLHTLRSSPRFVILPSLIKLYFSFSRLGAGQPPLPLPYCCHGKCSHSRPTVVLPHPMFLRFSFLQSIPFRPPPTASGAEVISSIIRNLRLTGRVPTPLALHYPLIFFYSSTPFWFLSFLRWLWRLEPHSTFEDIFFSSSLVYFFFFFYMSL